MYLLHELYLLSKRTLAAIQLASIAKLGEQLEIERVKRSFEIGTKDSNRFLE